MNPHHHQRYLTFNRVLSKLHAALLVLAIVAISLVLLLPNNANKRQRKQCNSTTKDEEKQLKDDASKSDPNKYFAVHLTPEQVHLSLGASPDEFVVTWVTLNQTATPSMVKFGLVNTGERMATGTVTAFTDGGPLKMVRYVHRVRLTSLLPDSVYVYHCGSSDSWSNLYRFKTLPAKKVGPEWTLNLLIFGDLGNGQAKTLSMLQDEVEFRRPDLVVQVGDFAYNLEDDNGRMGDAFFRDIEPITTQRPFQVCVGNHEAAYNFSHYDHRFSMYSAGSPEKTSNWYWSQNIGNVHLVALSTEFYYFPEFFGQRGLQAQAQYRWLQEDLKRANLPENRRRWPWIVTLGHRPMYNEFYVNDKIRVGDANFPGLEKLFYENGVDLAYWGHDHIYERILPVYNRKVLNGSSSGDPYRNPKSLVHLTTGSAGCILAPPALNPHRPDYSAYANADYSYTRMAVFNDTHLKVEQISQNQAGKAIDEFYLVKEKHGPYEAVN